MKTISSIYLLRSHKTLPISNTKFASPHPSVIATVLKNLQSVGYRVSKDLFTDLLDSSDAAITQWHSDVIPTLSKAVGSNVVHKPMYPNFPQQVINAPEAELLINSFLHYFGFGIGIRITPAYDKFIRGMYDEVSNLRTLDLGSDEEFRALVKSMISSKSSFSDTDKEDLEVIFKNAGKLRWLNSSLEIPNKENLATIAKLDTKYQTEIDLDHLFKTATDVLRLAVAYSDGDVSLAENTKFRKFRRFERRYILGRLERIKDIEEDMLRNKSQWKRLGEILHPGEHKNTFPQAFAAFTKLRNNEKIETYNSKVEAALTSKSYNDLAKLLLTRPGEFARRLDHILRVFKYHPEVVKDFIVVADQVSPSVLLQVRNYFQNKIDNPELPKLIIPKGNTNALRVIESNGLVPFDPVVGSHVVKACDNALSNIFSKREDMGTVFIDESLKGVAIPFALRNSSNSLDSFGRGTRFDLEDKNTLRFFLHWRDMVGSDSYSDRVDIDLSAISFDENFNVTGTVAYYAMRNQYAWHSGDFTSAPQGASEFIDLDIEKALEHGVRYVGMSVLSYSRQKFSEVPECFAGFMSRESPQSGEVFEAASVINKADLTSASTNSMPYLFDLKTRQAVWMDITIPSNPYTVNNVAGNASNLTLAVRAFALNKPPNLYDLFALHARGRGEQVFNRDEAEVVFAFDGDVTPRDTEKILDLYL